MTRPRVLALAGVLLLLVGALVLRGQLSSRPAASAAPAPSLAPLRARAALQPCPTGVGALPDLELACLGGGPAVRLAAPATGTPTLVTIYGSWCAPCAQETPLLVQLAARAGRRLALLGVDTEDDPQAALYFAIDFRAHWPSVVDEQGAVLRHFGSGPPVTLFVDGTGRVASVHQGRFHSLPELQAAVTQHLGVRL